MAPSTYTDSLRLIDQANGENATTWGDLADTNFNLIDYAIAGVFTRNMTGSGDYTLTTANGSDDEARAKCLRFTGTPSASRNVIIPSVEKEYLVIADQTGQNIVVKTASDAGVTFIPGARGIVYCDGSTVKLVANVTTNALITTNNLSDLTNVSAALSTLNVYTKPVIDAALSNTTSSILTKVYPVGSIYLNANNPTNPSTLLGFGVWTTVGAGRVLVGVGVGVDANGVSATFSATQTGGEYQHTLTTAEMPQHNHGYGDLSISLLGGAANSTVFNNAVTNPRPNTDPFRTSFVGSSQSFNLQQPYLAVYMWKRDS